jgi:hypothetical protein
MFSTTDETDWWKIGTCGSGRFVVVMGLKLKALRDRH